MSREMGKTLAEGKQECELCAAEFCHDIYAGLLEQFKKTLGQ